MGHEEVCCVFDDCLALTGYHMVPATLLIRGQYMESGRSGEMADYNSGASNKVV